MICRSLSPNTNDATLGLAVRARGARLRACVWQTLWFYWNFGNPL